MNERARKELDKDILMAATFHVQQRNKNGENYILHPLRVMFRMETIIEDRWRLRYAKNNFRST